MAEEKTFKGFPLDNWGNVKGAFPCVDIQQKTEDFMKQLAEKTNQAIIEYCLKFNIDPDVLIKQKAEIELLQIKIEKMKCCGNCIYCKYDENEESYEFCEKHNQVVNIAIQPCSEYETYNFDKAIKEIKE